MRAEPDANTKRIAREVGLSHRSARRLLRQLEADGVVRPRLRDLRKSPAVWACLAVVCGALVTWATIGRPAAPPPPPARQPARSAEEQAKEKALYQARARRDPALLDQALVDLGGEDEATRLAAVRYLAAVGASGHVEALRPLLADRSEQVRLATIQLLGQTTTSVDLRPDLARILASSDRPLSERLTAAGSLRQHVRLVAATDPVPPLLLPALLDERTVVRDRTVELLAALTGKLVPAATTPAALHAAWTAALSATN